MAKETLFVKNKLGRRFEMISSSPNTLVLSYPGHMVATHPIQSNGYANCNGVALIGQNVVGLSHYNLDKGSPEKYIPQLLLEISAIGDISEVSAIVVGGDESHFKKNISILMEYEIPIVGEYCDGWMDENDEATWSIPGVKESKAEKHLIVDPVNQEVLMYSEPVNYVMLTPRRI